jgi:hypothetical protein
LAAGSSAYRQAGSGGVVEKGDEVASSATDVARGAEDVAFAEGPAERGDGASGTDTTGGSIGPISVAPDPVARRHCGDENGDDDDRGSQWKRT